MTLARWLGGGWFGVRDCGVEYFPQGAVDQVRWRQRVGGLLFSTRGMSLWVGVHIVVWGCDGVNLLRLLKHME